jgi:hypothetical protein
MAPRIQSCAGDRPSRSCQIRSNRLNASGPATGQSISVRSGWHDDDPDPRCLAVQDGQECRANHHCEVVDRSDGKAAGRLRRLKGRNVQNPLKLCHDRAETQGQVKRAQVAGLYRTRFGDIEITAIADGIIPLDSGIVQGADPAAVAAATEASALANPFTGHVNAFTVNTGNKLYLIDASGLAAFIPSPGRFSAGLAAAGIAPELADQVLLTHLHVQPRRGADRCEWPGGLRECRADHACRRTRLLDGPWLPRKRARAVVA